MGKKIRELENRSIQIIQYVGQRVRVLKKNEQSQRNVKYNFTQQHIRTGRTRRRGETGAEKNIQRNHG